jgi:hypothetical protein
MDLASSWANSYMVSASALRGMPLRRTLSLLADMTVSKNVRHSLSILPRRVAFARLASSCVRSALASVLLLLLATFGLPSS